MMNYLVQNQVNQMKNQAQDLIPKDLKEENNTEEGKINDSNSSASNNIKSSNAPKKKKSRLISKALAIKMYILLLVHTGILTIVEYMIHSIEENDKIFSNDPSALIIYWIVFGGSIVAALALSLMASKIRCFSSLYFIYVLYIVLLALDLCIFNIGGQFVSFDIFVSMLIIFDAGSIVVLLFCSFIKEPPSTFWIICSSSGGIILAVFLCSKLYEENRILVLIFGVLSFIIYQVMNYNTFNPPKSKKKRGELSTTEQESVIPSAMVLPYEFNASFIKIFFIIFKGIVYIIKGCIGGSKKNNLNKK